MTLRRDPRALFWGLLGLLVAMELLFSSRWWQPPRPTAAADPATLRSQLAAVPPPRRVWFAPYTTFPETGMLESVSRGGIYDTLLAMPTSGIASNYGAFKLSPADGLFSLASAHGLAAELRLARLLGFRLYALDLGAVRDPQAGARLCRQIPGCRLSSDAYALFPIGAAPGPLEVGLATLQRRTPQLPLQSAGPSWGPLVLPQTQWGAAEIVASASGHDGGAPRLVVQAKAELSMELFRYGLDRYPRAVQPLLRLANDDVAIALADDVVRAQLCLGPVGQPCRLVELGPGHRSLAIGDLIPPDRLSRIEILSLLRIPNGRGTFSLVVRSPQASRALQPDPQLMVSAATAQAAVKPIVVSPLAGL